jgi:hypothetical protein
LKQAVSFKRGVLFVGINRPWYASRGAVRSELRNLGAGVVSIRFFDREQPLPSGVNPRRDPLYQDNWDEWIELTYDGPDRVLHLERVWKWILLRKAKPSEVFPVDPALANPELDPGDPKDGKGIGSLFVLLFPWAALGVWALRKTRTRH